MNVCKRDSVSVWERERESVCVIEKERKRDRERDVPEISTLACIAHEVTDNFRPFSSVWSSSAVTSICCLRSGKK